MLYKDYLGRIGQPLITEEEKRKAERKRERKKNPQAEVEVDSDSGDDEEEPELIKWELEWWRKPGAPIITETLGSREPERWIKCNTTHFLFWPA